MIRALFQMAGLRQAAHDLNDSEWAELLAFADRTQLTLYLRGLPGSPAWVECAIESRYRRNLERRRRLRQAFIEVSQALEAEGIEFVLLKGFTHEAGLGIRGGLRAQYDLDFLCQSSDLARAYEIVQRQGYAPHGKRSLSGEHARPLVRASNWHWRGDYYDPDMPIPIELHDTLWNAAQEHLTIGDPGQFWRRRTSIDIDGRTIPALCETDRAAFAALHALRHILRHDARPAHVLELARFLDARAEDPRFWEQWRELYDPHLRTFQMVGFRFAREWFECSLPTALEAEWLSQPEPVIAWFRDFAWSPVANLRGRNKDTVWLHMALASSRRDRVRIFCDRLAPLRFPHHDEPVPYWSRFLRRLRYHAGALAPALLSGLRWWRRRVAASTASQIPD